jgi:hypothetical protein
LPGQVSPFGQLAPVVAAVAALAVVFGYGIALFLGNTAAQDGLQPLAIFAAGIIFGGATAVPAINGHVAVQAAAANSRLDALGAPPAETVTRGGAGDGSPH